MKIEKIVANTHLIQNKLNTVVCALYNLLAKLDKAIFYTADAIADKLVRREVAKADLAVAAANIKLEAQEDALVSLEADHLQALDVLATRYYAAIDAQAELHNAQRRDAITAIGAAAQALVTAEATAAQAAADADYWEKYGL